MTALGNQTEAFALDLGDDQSRYVYCNGRNNSLFNTSTNPKSISNRNNASPNPIQPINPTNLNHILSFRTNTYLHLQVMS